MSKNMQKQDDKHIQTDARPDSGINTNISETTNPHGEEELNKLKAELEKRNSENKELYDRLLRKQAELENYRKRMQKEQAEIIKFAHEELIRKLLPVMDDFERALEAAGNTQEPAAIREGIELIFNQFKSILDQAGLETVKAVGEKFDPARHEAVRLIESHEHEDNTVLEELRKGYSLNKRIIRASMVVVSKKKEKEEKKEEKKNQHTENKEKKKKD